MINFIIMKKYLLLPLLAMLYVSENCHADVASLRLSKDSLKQVVQTLNDGFRNKDMQLIQRCLSERFSVSTASMPYAQQFLDRLVEYRALDDITLVDIDSSTWNTTLVKVAIKSRLGDSESIIAFDEYYKVVFIDFLDRIYGHSRYNVSETKAVIPFAMTNEAIVVPLKLNDCDTTLYFFLDTGADGMAIRKTLADSLHLSTDHDQDANIVGGVMNVPISRNNTVHLTGSFALNSQNIALFDKIGYDWDGSIGLNMAQNYIVDINFDTQQITLSTFGKCTGKNHGEIIPITNHYGLITLDGSLNLTGEEDIAGKFVFDSGAGFHLIVFDHFVRRHHLQQTDFKPEAQSVTESMGHITTIFTGKAQQFSFSPHLIYNELPIALQVSSSPQKDEQTPDGSIGIELIRQFNVTIDLLQKELTLTPRNDSVQTVKK